ncbi:MAG TPA: NAD(P)/FAD-dependent oxidoreductase, partial [Acidimicrobiales bacterium]
EQPKILDYFNHVADRYDVRPHFRFHSKVTSAVWDDAASRWDVATDDGVKIRCQYLVLATGVLSAFKMPELPGLDTFEGESYHTARWPHDKAVEFAGKKVGVIGTGSSGVQCIPMIAKEAADLWVFQRTPNFVFPAHNREFTQEEIDVVKRNYTEYRAAARDSKIGISWPEAEFGAFEVSDEERVATYERLWGVGNIMALLTVYDDILTDKEANDTLVEFIHGKIKAIVKDPELAELLCPKNHPVGIKRPVLDTGYFECFNQDNVHLVDLRSAPLVEITPKGVKTTDHEYELDLLVLATGFDAVTGSFLRIDIRGKDGLTLREKWADGPRALLGITSSGFPNMFTITGPQSPNVLAHMVSANEQHIEWVRDLIAFMRDEGYEAIDADPLEEQKWFEHAEEIANATLYPTADTWFMGANVPGKPRVLLPYLGGFDVYRTFLDSTAAKGYDRFALRR